MELTLFLRLACCGLAQDKARGLRCSLALLLLLYAAAALLYAWRETLQLPIPTVRLSRPQEGAEAGAVAAKTTALPAAGPPPEQEPVARGPSDVGWPWTPQHRGGELHKDVGQVLRKEQHLPAVLRVLQLLQPEPGRCRCRLERWDQYAVCKGAFRSRGSTPVTALSLGINQYDLWAHHIQERHQIVPQAFDCFNTKRPFGFPSLFSPTCVGQSEETVEGRNYTTLSQLLQRSSWRSAGGAGGREPPSVLVKMDIEGSELEVLAGLRDADWALISSLHVEFHMQDECLEERHWYAVAELLAQVRRRMAVVDAAASYYEPECRLGSTVVPKLFAVSYMAREACVDPEPEGPLRAVRAKVGQPREDMIRGGEHWQETSRSLLEVSLSRKGSHEALQIFRSAAPQPDRCPCELERWGEKYAACGAALKKSRRALSFGIGGYDDWGRYLREAHGVVPQTFDCMNTIKPEDFENVFSPLCIHGGHGEPKDTVRQYTTLSNMLTGAENASSLVKLDVEAEEYNVLLELKRSDWARMSALHVTYHLDFGCLEDTQWITVRTVLERARLTLAVVDGIAVYYGPDCFYGGLRMPKRLLVSYTADAMCQ